VENLLPHLRNPHFVAVFRNPFSISRSSAERDSRDFNLRLLQVAANHTKRVVDLLEKLEAPAALVCFESAVRQPETFVSNLAEFIGVEVGEVTATEVSQSAIQPGKGYLEF
jgi:hypothetical protein